jgi:uncharacterized protein (TIGR02145 family)
MKTEDRATPLFTATAFVVISSALFFLSGCSADTSVAGASEEESTVSYEAVNQGTALMSAFPASKVVHGEFTDPRDGQKYRTVKIMKKTWFAQNLNYETANSWCYSEDDSNCERFGRLYTHADAAKACPAGWRLPTMREFMTLYGNTASSSAWSIQDVTQLVVSETPNAHAKDEYGFSIEFAGARSGDGKFSAVGTETYLWTSTGKDTAGKYVAQKIVLRPQGYVWAFPDWGPEDDAAFSVRCTKR